MIMIAAGLALAFVLAHMARPRFKRQRLSAARFFANLPNAQRGTPKLRIANPLKSRPFWFHLPIVGLLLFALLSMEVKLNGGSEQGVGLWIALDTSASMMTREAGVTRFDLALDTLAASLDEVAKRDGKALCLGLSRFDLAEETLATSFEGGTALLQQAQQLRPRPLGTDLRLVRQLARRLTQNPPVDCPVTHLLVISDQPPPQWLDQVEELRVIWRLVGQPQTNVGFTQVEALRDPLSGIIRRIRIHTAAFGDSHEDVTLSVKDPDGIQLLETTLVWEDGRWQGLFEPTVSGTYTLEMDTEDSYDLDDSIQIEVHRRANIRVDWQHRDTRLPRQLGWEVETKDADIRIADFEDLSDDSQPTLYVGRAYGQTTTATQLGYFAENHAMLQDLNFDAVESLAIAGAKLPEGFDPILLDAQGAMLLAYRKQPPAAYTPGLPQLGDADAEAVSAILFFNALRTLLDLDRPEPLYDLTTPDAPDLEAGRLALHPGEGNTALSGSSYGSLDDLQAVPIKTEGKPIWPLCVALAALLLMIERGLAFWRGDRWR